MTKFRKDPTEHRGWIDSMSLYQVVDFFGAYYNKAERYPWTEHAVMELTLLLMLTSHQSVAQGAATKSHDDPQRRLTDQLLAARLVTPTPVSADARNQAIQQIAKWALQPAVSRRLRTETAALLADCRNFQYWIHWVVDSQALVTHRTTHANLLDKEFGDAIGIILGMTPHDLKALQAQCGREAYVASIKADTALTHHCEAIAVYVCSALMRGAVHALIADASSKQLTPHPLRESIRDLVALDDPASNSLQVSWVAMHLAELIINIASREHSLEGRLAAWVEKIALVRRSLHDSEHALDDAHGQDRAERDAFSLGMKAGIVSAPHHTYVTFELAQKIATTTAVAYSVSGLNPNLRSAVHHILEIGVDVALGEAATARRLADKYEQLTQERLLRRGSGLVRRRWLERSGVGTTAS